jgi:hypothetical protein
VSEYRDCGLDGCERKARLVCAMKPATHWKVEARRLDKEYAIMNNRESSVCGICRGGAAKIEKRCDSWSMLVASW